MRRARKAIRENANLPRSRRDIPLEFRILDLDTLINHFILARRNFARVGPWDANGPPQGAEWQDDDEMSAQVHKYRTHIDLMDFIGINPGLWAADEYEALEAADAQDLLREDSESSDVY